MKFTLDWLKKYVDTGNLTPEELAEHLTMLGLEVDSVTQLFQELSALLTGLVISTEKHPDADKLTLCQVQIGEDTHQIVCGAPNVREGLAVVVALPGTVLPGDFKIKKSKIRGVASAGMICSERELGLSNEHEGIMELPEGTVHGQSFIETMSLADTCIEIDLTPNRPDCASVIGVAREVASIVRNPLTLPVSGENITQESNEFEVEIESPDLCPRYAGRLIKDVKVGPSPWWLRKLLLSVGLRPINNIVDITNFVMLEYGQPLHAFDFDTISGQKIVVRTPREDENSFSTLDETKREIDSSMLMICDADRPIAVAGVMGGLNSEVTDDTVNILLESACFNPISVRKTARQLNLSTDASYRFERGVDPDGTINALNRATQLIAELGGGTAPADGIDNYPGQKELTVLPLNVQRTNTLLGLRLSIDEMMDMLQAIELVSVKNDNENLSVTIPSFRIDLEREADLVEEIARLYGYNNIPTTLPSVDLSYPEQDDNRLKRLAISDSLTTQGYTEAINYSFISAKEITDLGLSSSDNRHNSVQLLNPLSEDQSILRTTLLPGLLQNLRRNINFQKPSVRLFELGKVFHSVAKDKQPEEINMVAGVLSGSRYGDSPSLYYKQDEVDVFDAKGVVEFIIQEMGLLIVEDKSAIHFHQPEELDIEPFAEPLYFLELFQGETKVGTLGKLKDEVIRRYGIKNDVYYFDLNFDLLCDFPVTEKQFSSLPVYPSVKRDIALVVPESVSAGKLLAAVKGRKEKLIENTAVFDVFQGEKIPEGFKSVALTITYRSQTKTLTEKNVEKSHSKIVRMLTDQFGGSFRNA